MNLVAMKICRLACVVLLSLAYVGSASAQRNMASLEGTVADQSGAVIYHANVSLVNEDTAQAFHTTTDKGGRFTILQILPGRYTLNVLETGFKQYTQRHIILNVDDRPDLRIGLSVGAISQDVTVDAENPVLDATTANVESLVDIVNVNDLPLDGRQFLDLTLILPGVSPAAGGQTVNLNEGPLNTGVQAGGNRPTNNTYLIDGVDSFGFRFKNTSLRPSIAAIQQFKVLESPYDPQYGVVSGLNVNVITKAGTNRIRGEAFEFFRNDGMDAQGYFDQVDPNNPANKLKPLYQQNQYGGTLGGPLHKDRAFLFGSYEGLQTHQGTPVYSLVPTALERTGDFSQSVTLNATTGAFVPVKVIDPTTGVQFPNNKIPADRISPISTMLMPYFPMPNTSLGTAASGTGTNFVDQDPNHIGSYQAMGRADYSLSSRFQIFGRYNYSDVNYYSPGALSEFGTYVYMTVQNGAFGATYTINANTVFDLRLGYNRENALNKSQQIGHKMVSSLGIAGLDLSSDPTVDGVPKIIITNLATIGDATNSPESRVENSEQIVPSFLHTTGRHSLRIGATIWPVQLNRVSVSGTQRGQFGFSTTYTSVPLADFELGLANTAVLSTGRGHEDARTILSSYYIGDTFRATPRLTLIGGLRYELTPAFIDKGNRLSTFVPEGNGRVALAGDPDNGFTGRQNRALYGSPLTHVFPRVAFALDLDGRARTLLRGGFGIFGNIPIFNSAYLSALSPPFSVTRSYLANKASGVNLPFANPFSTNPDAGGLPGGDEITPGFKEGYMEQWSLGIQRAIGASTGLDVEYVGNKGTHLDGVILVNQGGITGTANVAYYRPFQSWGEFTAADSFAYSHYDSLRGKIQRRFSHGLTFISAYTYAHSLDDSPGEGNGSGNEFVATDFYHPEHDYSNSDFDVRHRFTQSGVWNIPIGKGYTFLSGHTGIPGAAVKVVSDWRVSGIWQWQTGFPFTVLEGADVSGTSGSDARASITCSNSVAQEGRQQARWFNIGCFKTSAAGTFGNSGRNLIRYSGQDNLDVSVARSFPFSESRAIEFRGELFNALNHTQFSMTGGMGATLGAVTFGKYSATQPARIGQLALRILF